jgi:hypothetical protein
MQKKQLLNNWGEKADTMQCYAPVRFYDALSKWECYIYAMNSADENEILTLINWPAGFIVANSVTMNDLEGLFNEHGEGIVNDVDYRPIKLPALLRAMRKHVYKEIHNED